MTSTLLADRTASRPAARTVASPVAGAALRRPTRTSAGHLAGRRSARAVTPPAPVQRVRPVAEQAGGLHLTRRGRLALVALLVVLLTAAFSLGRVGAEGSTAAAPELRTVVVAPGDTLWGVASELVPGEDPRPVVDQIRRLNDLRSGELRTGQLLVLPAAG